MAVGEGGFHIADAYVEIHADEEPFRREVAGLGTTAGREAETGGKGVGSRLGKGIGDGADGNEIGERVTRDIDRTIRPRAQRSGNDAGNKLSKGFQLAMVRNSPLIAAAIAGALMTGAPVAIAGVTSLFAAIAAASVSGNIQVSTQFKQLGDHIKDTFRQAGQVAIPYFLESIHRLSAGISGLGPQFRTAFAALGPSIDSLTTGVLKFVQNSMPGMVGAVKSAEPVMRGLSDLLGDIGSGLSDFFDNVSAHAPAAGGAFSALGSILSALLPILGDLLGEGAELANAVLPPIAAALHVVAGALHLVAPALPAVVGGLLALKAASAASAALAGLNQSLAMASYSSSRLAPVAGAASTALSGLRSILPVVAIAAVGLTLAMKAGRDQIDSWGKALIQGGNAAEQAAAQMKHIDDVTQPGLSGLHSWADVWDRIKALTLGTTDAQNKGAAAARNLLSAMSPLERAGQAVTKAQNDYLTAVEKYGPASGQAAGAAVAFRDASQKQKDVQDQLNIAIHGVTQAMIDQADEALAAIDSNFALQHAQNQQRDAELQLADAIKQHGAASNEAHDAQQAYVESIYNTAKAAAQLKADQSGLTQGSVEYKNVLDTQLLKSLQAVESTLSGPEKVAIDGFIKQLEAAGVTSDGVGDKLDNLGQKKPTPQVRMDSAQFQSIYNYVTGAINTLGGKKPTPTAFLNSQPFGGAAASMNAMLSYLASRHITPSASLIAYTLAAEQAINYTARDRVVHITTFTRAAVASGGKIGDVVGLAGRRFDGGGKLHGPGGPTDDLIPAQSMAGAPIRLSNTEWIINAAVSRAQGDARMAALNSGRADIVPKGATVTGQASLSIGELHVHIEGSFDFTKPDTIRTLAQKLDTALAELHRSRS